MGLLKYLQPLPQTNAQPLAQPQAMPEQMAPQVFSPERSFWGNPLSMDKQPGVLDFMLLGPQGVQQKRDFQQRQMAQDFQLPVQQETFQRQRQGWNQQDQQMRDWQAAVQGEQNPQRRTMLQAIGPQGYGEFIAGEQRLQATQQESAADRAFTAQQNALDRNNRMSVANMGRDPLATAQGRIDYNRVVGMGDASILAQQSVLPRIQRMRENLTKLAALGGVNQPVGAGSRILLSRLSGFGPEAKSLLEQIERDRTMMTLDIAEKLKPMSNTDVSLIQSINPNGDMTLSGALSILDAQEAELQRGVTGAREASRWFDANRSLGPNAQGQTFEDYLARQYPQAPGAPSPPAPPPGGPRTPPPEAIATLRRDTSAQARREFDEVFGPGAAAKALAQPNRSQRPPVTPYGGVMGGL